MKVKVMRHNERLRENVRPTKGCLHSKVDMIVPTQKVLNGIVRKGNELTAYDPVENFKQYDARDFALENIIAAGAVDMLKDAGSVGYGSLENAEIVDAAVVAMENSINNNVNNSAE